MRTSIWTAFAAVTALGACNKPASPPPKPPVAPSNVAAPTAPAPQSAAQFPHRKAGLWRQIMTMEGVDQAMPVTEICLDDASQARMSMMGQQLSKAHCAQPQFNRNLDGSYNFTASCDMGPDGRSTTTGTFSGDFNSSYKAVIDTTMSGAAAAAANGEHHMTITATWVGPCAPDQKPGDMIMANGMKMNILNRPGG